MSIIITPYTQRRLRELTMRMIVRFLKIVYTGMLRYCYHSAKVHKHLSITYMLHFIALLTKLFEPV